MLLGSHTLKGNVPLDFVITQEVMANINVLCARVLNRILGNFYGTFIVTKGVGSYLVSHQSPKGFALYIGLEHNMHRPLYIPLPRWTKPRNFASYSTKKLENAQASGNPRRYSCDPHAFGVPQAYSWGVLEIPKDPIHSRDV